MINQRERFQELLQEYILAIQAGDSEATVRHRCLEFLRDSLGISLVETGDELEQRVFRGRADAVLGKLVFEFKRDLAASLAEAEGQLGYYLADLHRREPGAVYTTVATDGLRFHVYRPVYNVQGEASLQPIGNLDLERSVPSPLTGEGQDGGERRKEGRLVADASWDAYLWLDSLFAHFRTERARPTARSIVVALGHNSPTFRHAFAEMLAVFQEAKASPEVAVRFQEWQSYLSIVHGSAVGDESLFVRHTYLSLIARLIARFFLEPRVMLASGDALKKTVNGDYFRGQGIANFIEDDFFTWPLAPGTVEEGLGVVRRLANSLSAYDFSQAQQDLLKSLYEELVDPETRHDLGEYCTPDWLAEYVLDAELGLSQDPHRSILDPSCGSGTFLFTAIRLAKEALLARGEDGFDALFHIQGQIMGMDVHPVAVTIARTNYLLALGDLVQGPHPPVLLPVYLSNAIILPGSTAGKEPLGGYAEPVHTIQTSEPGVVFELPHSVVTDPQMLDWLFSRITNYLAGAALRLQMQTQEEATQDVLIAFRNYLLSAKPKTPIPQPLTDFAADLMVEAARTLIKLYLQGRDHVWVYILKNIPASVYLSQRKFDLVVGNPPWLSMRYIRDPQYRQQVRSLILRDYQLLSPKDAHLFTHLELATLFFARCADLYLKTPPLSPPYQGGDKGGVIAFVMPRAVLTARQHQRFSRFFFKGGSQILKLERVLDLEQVSPLFNVPACVLIAQAGQQTTFPASWTVLQGLVPSRNAGWEDAKPRLKAITTTFDG